MQVVPVVFLCAAISAGVAMVTSSLSPSEPPFAPSHVDPAAAVAVDLDALADRCAKLERQLARAVAQPVRAPVAATGVDPDSVRAIVMEALVAAGVTSAEPTESGTKPIADHSAEELFDRLQAMQAAGESTGDLWAELDAAGRLDEVLDVYRAAVDLAPQSTEAHHDLARAAHGAAMSRPNHKNGTLWVESDDAYGKVLDLDPQHWDARYEKAVKLTFWPGTFGRRPEAMQHFETLIEQQRSLPPAAEHARVFLWLGNLHAQQGNVEAASKVWRQGLERHPQAEELRQRLSTVGG